MGSITVFAAAGTVWRWRRLVRELARREFRARYAGSALGALWSVLEPAIQFGLYLTVFSYFLGMRLEGRPGVGSFGFYLVSGLVPFLALQESLVRSAGLARANAGLVRHVNVPLEALLAGSLLAILARHGIAIGLVLLAGVATGSITWVQLPWALVGLLLVVAIVWGAGLLLLPAGGFLPDLGQIVATASTVFFFLTPIVYPETLLPKAAARWLELNPVVGVLDAFRSGFTGHPVSLRRLVVSALAAVLTLAAGAEVFRRRAAAVRDLV